MWVVHFTDKNGKATVSVCQSRDAAFKSARGLREHLCAVHYISGPNGARIELKEILDLVLATGTKCRLTLRKTQKKEHLKSVCGFEITSPALYPLQRLEKAKQFCPSLRWDWKLSLLAPIQMVTFSPEGSQPLVGL